MHHSFVGPRALILAPVLFLLVIAMGCGGAAAEPIVVEKEVIKEIIKEIPIERQIIKEVLTEVVVEKEVLKEVVVEGDDPNAPPPKTLNELLEEMDERFEGLENNRMMMAIKNIAREHLVEEMED